MSESPVTRVIVIKNLQGMHARPAEMFARRALQFEAKIELVVESQWVDGKSILHLLTLGARHGTQIVIEADGPDAARAVEALADLVENEFPREDAAE
jgi:phosphotransferase system HPr (HPr) family protein